MGARNDTSCVPFLASRLPENKTCYKYLLNDVFCTNLTACHIQNKLSQISLHLGQQQAAKHIMPALHDISSVSCAGQSKAHSTRWAS